MAYSRSGLLPLALIGCIVSAPVAACDVDRNGAQSDSTTVNRAQLDAPAIRTAGFASAPKPSPGPPVGPRPVFAGSPPTDEAATAHTTPAPPSTLDSLTAQERRALHSGMTDGPVPVAIHYAHSNETRHDLFFPYIAGRGGAYVGVGSDQNYTLMAVASARYAFILDIDARVIDLHRIYEILIRHHTTAKQLVHAWRPEQAAATRALLAAATSGRPELERRRIRQEFTSVRETVYRHLKRAHRRTHDGDGATWLSNPRYYEHVRKMFLAGRVRPMLGDLAGTHSVQAVASACRALAAEISTFYLSNAEEYFMYTPAFVANIEALPFDEDAAILRTIYDKQWPHADLWAYQVHAIDDFRLRLDQPRNRARKPMLRYAKADGGIVYADHDQGLSTIGIDS